MYPKDILPGIDLYIICLCLAVIAAIVTYRVLSDKMKLGAKLQNLCIYTAVAAIIGGYFSAVFFQALYNIKKYGEFVINSQTGATFYGGLIGGAAIFLAIYFLVGARLFDDGEHIKNIFNITDIGACSIVIAHAIGRVGCLMAGCCHGKATDAWFGIYMESLGYKVIPTQLFEAIFLAFLFMYLILRIRDKQTYCLQIYMAAYGAWRFVIEYLRADYRGSTFVDFVTPSQLTAILMVIGAVALIFVQRRIQVAITKPKNEKTDAEQASDAVTKTADDEEEEEYEYDYGYNSESSNSDTDDTKEKKD